MADEPRSVAFQGQASVLATIARSRVQLPAAPAASPAWARQRLPARVVKCSVPRGGFAGDAVVDHPPGPRESAMPLERWPRLADEHREETDEAKAWRKWVNNEHTTAATDSNRKGRVHGTRRDSIISLNTRLFAKAKFLVSLVITRCQEFWQTGLVLATDIPTLTHEIRRPRPRRCAHHRFLQVHPACLRSSSNGGHGRSLGQVSSSGLVPEASTQPN